MLKRYALMIAAMGLVNNTMAASFQLFAQDGASIGNYHAGYAAIAEDASTGFYNPAGLIKIKNQEIVVGSAFLLTDIRYRGTLSQGTNTSPTLFFSNAPVTAQGGSYSFLPNVHYAAPLSDVLVLGLSFVTPFAVKTDYGTDSLLRYATTLTQMKVTDISPSIGYAFSNKFSLGAGLDIEHMYGIFQQNSNVSNSTILNPDTLSRSAANDNAYGYHLGALLQFSPQSRIGIGYHSQVVHHLTGKSTFTGPLANGLAGGTQTSQGLQARVTLPPSTSVSFFHTINPTFDVMGTVMYTQWNVFNNLVLKNVAANLNGASTNTAQIVVQQGYRNSWTYALGANYHATEKFMLRTGLGWDETPVTNAFRTVRLPDSDRLAVALGGHYQLNKAIACDISWTHLFVMNARINNVVQPLGDEVVTTNGTVKSSADVYGFQLKWDIF